MNASVITELLSRLGGKFTFKEPLTLIYCGQQYSIHELHISDINECIVVGTNRFSDFLFMLPSRFVIALCELVAGPLLKAVNRERNLF